MPPGDGMRDHEGIARRGARASADGGGELRAQETGEPPRKADDRRARLSQGAPWPRVTGPSAAGKSLSQEAGSSDARTAGVAHVVVVGRASRDDLEHRQGTDSGTADERDPQIPPPPVGGDEGHRTG